MKAETAKMPEGMRTENKSEPGTRCWEGCLGPMVLHSKESAGVRLPTADPTNLHYPVTF